MSSYTKNEKNIYLLNDKNIVQSFDENYEGVNPVASQKALSDVHEYAHEVELSVDTGLRSVRVDFTKADDEVIGKVDEKLTDITAEFDGKLEDLSNDLTSVIDEKSNKVAEDCEEKILCAKTELNDVIQSAESRLGEEVKTKVSTAYRLAGVVDTLDILKGRIQTYNGDPSTVSSHVGEVYSVREDGSGLSGQNYVVCYQEGSGSILSYDALGGIVDFGNYYDKAETDEKFSDVNQAIAGLKQDISDVETSAEVSVRILQDRINDVDGKFGDFYTADQTDGKFETLLSADQLRTKVGELETGLFRNLKFFGEIELDESDSLSASLKSFFGLNENLALNGLFVYVSVKDGKQSVQTRDGFRLEDGDFAVLHGHDDEKYIDLSRLSLGETLFIQRSRLTYDEVSKLSDDIKNKIPTNVSQLANDCHYLTSADVEPDLANPGRAKVATSAETIDYGNVLNTPDLAALSAATLNVAKISAQNMDNALKDHVNKSFYPLSGGALAGNLTLNGNFIHVNGLTSDGVYIAGNSDNRQQGYVKIGAGSQGGGLLEVKGGWDEIAGGKINVQGKNASITKNGKEVATEAYVESRGYISSVDWDNVQKKPVLSTAQEIKTALVGKQDILPKLSGESGTYDIRVREAKSSLSAKISEIAVSAGNVTWENVSGRPNLNEIVYVENGDLTSNSISVMQLPVDEYSEKLIRNDLCDNVLYIVDQDNLNGFGERVINVAEPESPYDAANKYYVDSKLGRALNYVASADSMLNSASDIQSLKTVIECLKNAISAVAVN